MRERLRRFQRPSLRKTGGPFANVPSSYTCAEKCAGRFNQVICVTFDRDRDYGLRSTAGSSCN